MTISEYVSERVGTGDLNSMVGDGVRVWLWLARSGESLFSRSHLRANILAVQLVDYRQWLVCFGVGFFRL